MLDDGGIGTRAKEGEHVMDDLECQQLTDVWRHVARGYAYMVMITVPVEEDMVRLEESSALSNPKMVQESHLKVLLQKS